MLTAVDVARKLADSLESEGIEYAIGGALALGFYATPRATVDVDINIFVPLPSGIDRIVDTLNRAGFEADDAESIVRTATSDGQFRGRVAGVRVDVFVPAIEFYASLATRKRQVRLLGRPLWILGAEDLLILKMMFFRRKDLADAEAVLRTQQNLDLGRVRATLVDFGGESDPRVSEWDDLVRDVGRQ